LKERVPGAVPGVAFLSGGQSPLDATRHLNLVHAAGPLPWTATFSYGRALQDDVLHAWVGLTANVEKAQAALLRRAQLNSLASTGAYRQSMETLES
jgi:fructose-bisphosphate aldolase class I